MSASHLNKSLLLPKLKIANFKFRSSDIFRWAIQDSTFEDSVRKQHRLRA
jgi:hypothetical protein